MEYKACKKYKITELLKMESQIEKLANNGNKCAKEDIEKIRSHKKKIAMLMKINKRREELEQRNKEKAEKEFNRGLLDFEPKNELLR